MGSIEAETQLESGITAQLCEWVSNLKVDDIPSEILTRAKYLILDGIACALVGARVPWSERYVQVTMGFEPKGVCSVIGYDKKLGPVAASMMNAAFIQATELDDYHSEAPLHAASIAIPAIFAAAESLKQSADGSANPPISGLQALLAAIVCFETGPRIGKAVHGADLLVQGWHCGAIYGAPAGALAAAKVFNLSADAMEDAVGIACTQACGLMSAQYGGMIKRVQHGFAARNGLLGALLARGGYEGIKKVLERPYGGFLTMFTKGNGKKVQYKEYEVVSDLGEFWHTYALRIKMYACCGLAHGAIEAIENLQRDHASLFELSNLKNITSVHVELSHSSYAHCGWAPHERPATSTGGQMSAPYILATQFVDRQCLLAQFSDANGNLDRPEVWDLVGKVTCSHNEEFDKLDQTSGGHVVVEFADGTTVAEAVAKPRGVASPIPNAKILDKYRVLAGSVMDEARVRSIEDIILNLETVDDIDGLIALLNTPVDSVFA
ncbi:MAG: cinnamoyl-Coa reductase [Claussenomyces sp. TS43310]|nr:MAG: cinnamoyl-Coa reductase [Claussenomyces sp. TS43310]